MSFISFILEYITYCFVFIWFFFTMILCFKIGKYLADFYCNRLKALRRKLIIFLRIFLSRKECIE